MYDYGEKMIHFSLILNPEGIWNSMYKYFLPIKRIFIDVKVLHTIDIINHLAMSNTSPSYINWAGFRQLLLLSI